MVFKNHPEICPICEEGRSFNFIRDFRENKDDFSLYQCLICQVQFWVPIKKTEANWYEKNSGYKLREVIGSYIFRDYHKKFLKKYQYVKNASILDLGCGSCSFLGALKNKGWEVWGVDFDKVAIEAGITKFNLNNIFLADFDDFFSRTDLPKFDFITFFEVIEHLTNPDGFVRNVKKLLKPNGKIILSVPSRERIFPNLNNWDFPPHHFTRWNRAAIENIFNKINFKLVSIEYIEQLKTIMDAINGKLGFGMVNKAVNRSIKKGKSSFFLPKIIYMMGRFKEHITGYLPAAFLCLVGKIRRQKNGIMLIELEENL